MNPNPLPAPTRAPLHRDRRHFLKTSTLVLGSLAANRRLLAAAATPPRSLGVALVGLGAYSTQNLAPALKLTQHCHLAGIVTGSPAKIPEWKARYGITDDCIYSYENFDRIASNPRIDVVYIVLPTGLHAEFAIRGAKAGKHVWCEKPMALTSKECQAIIDACARHRVRLTIGYRMQHEPNTQQFKRWATERPFGPITSVHSGMGWNMAPDPRNWRMTRALGGGFLYDIGVYPINGLRYVAQEEPLAVTAEHLTVRPEIFRETPEETRFTFEFPSGLRGTGIHTSREVLNSLEVTCADGWYKLSPFQTYDGIKGSASDGRVFRDALPNQQARQMDNDALAIQTGGPVLVPGEEGKRDIRILEAINESAATGRRVLI